MCRTPGLAHSIEQDEAVGDVVAEIELRRGHRFADIGEGGKMHDRRDLEAAQRFGRAARVGELADDERPPTHRFAMAAAEIVVGDGLEPGLGERLGGVAADIAGTPRHEDVLRSWYSVRPRDDNVRTRRPLLLYDEVSGARGQAPQGSCPQGGLATKLCLLDDVALLDAATGPGAMCRRLRERPEGARTVKQCRVGSQR